jgi:hypothetical protein
MRQQRIIFLLVALAAVLAIPAVGTTAAPIDSVKGPGCGDINLRDSADSGPPAYRGTEEGSATVDAVLATAKPSCSALAYTIYIYTDTTQATLIDSMTFNGNGASTFAWTYTFAANAPHSVCVAATSTRDGRIVDAAPNDFTPGSTGSGCYTLVINTPPGGSGLN